MFLTHRDDVADHAKIAKRFGCTRVLHAADVTSETRAVERTVDGEAPTRLDEDLLIIPVPGHTRGSAALLFRDFALFTGDHLFATQAGDALFAARSVCWYSWEAQTRSLEKLLAFDFEWVLPGHEGRMRMPSALAMREQVRAAIDVARSRH
jgi:glyoxylase-like metal-dependent hydrolase (beta-lactamase superfamily II)